MSSLARFVIARRWWVIGAWIVRGVLAPALVAGLGRANWWWFRRRR